MLKSEKMRPMCAATLLNSERPVTKRTAGRLRAPPPLARVFAAGMLTGVHANLHAAIAKLIAEV